MLSEKRLTISENFYQNTIEATKKRIKLLNKLKVNLASSGEYGKVDQLVLVVTELEKLLVRLEDPLLDKEIINILETTIELGQLDSTKYNVDEIYVVPPEIPPILNDNTEFDYRLPFLLLDPAPQFKEFNYTLPFTFAQ